MLLRRRVSALGQNALKAAWGLDASVPARCVFASRHGEFGRTLSIMEALVRAEGVSPADFTLSVHHALAGLLSIAQGNRLGHSAVAAGRESLFCGVMEAAACLAETPDQPVILVYYDEPLPEPFAHFSRDGEETVALALLLTSGADGLGLMLSTVPVGDGAAELRPGHRFIEFLQNDAARIAINGDRQLWSFEKIHAQP